MKRFVKYKKNIILSLILAFMFCFGIGVTIPVKKASAEISDIYTVPTANFFNIEGNYDLVKTSGSQIVLKFEVSYDPNFNGFRIEILENIDNGSLKFALYSLNDNGGALPDLNIPGYYSFSAVLRDENNSVVDNGCNISFFNTLDSSISNAFPILNNNFAYIGQNSNGTVDFSRGVKYVEFTFGNISASGSQGFASYTAGEVFYICDICVNYGQENQPYQPYYYRGIVDDDSSSDDSSSVDGTYDDGYSDGYDSGYAAGLAEGLKSAQYGIFANCEVTLHIVSSSNNALGYIQEDFSADIEYVYGGLSLTPSYFNYNSTYKDSVLSSWITFSWSNTDSVFPNNFKLKGYGTSDLFMDSLSHSLYWDMESSDSSYIPFLMWENINSNDSYLSPVFASSLGAHSGFPNVESEILSLTTPVLSNLDYLNGFSLVMSDISYESGYNAGLIAGDEDTYNKGYNQGVTVGKDEGFKSGLSQGLSEDAYGLGQFMYAYLDMPGRILSNWLNFDFLGINLLGLVTFLLSICLVVFVLKKVV